MSVINTNITSMIGQSNLQKSQNALQTSMERLSSGLRINSAKDDAAGQAIANRMSAQITGLAQAQRNANDGISVAQTAEGSLNQVNDNLQRIRELTVQAANGTNSSNDLQSIQDEINQRLDEINRISDETNFNGVNVLKEDNALKIQVGANDGETITVNLKEINAETLGLGSFDVRNTLASSSLSDVGDTLVEAKDAVDAVNVTLSFPDASGSAELVVGSEGGLLAKVDGFLYDAEYDAATNTVSFDSSGTASTETETSADSYVDGDGTLIQLSTLADAIQDDDGSSSDFEIYRENATGTLVISDGTDSWTVGTNGTSIDFETGQVTLGDADDTTISDFAAYTEVTDGEADPSALVLSIPGSAAQAEVTVEMGDVDLEGTNTLQVSEDGDYFIRNEAADGAVTFYNATVDQETGVVTLGAEATNIDPLNALDAALNKVDSLRSELGAVQNRFEDAITNLSTNETNLAAARSRIEDADYAVEVANMTRAQILQQAGTSVLAQANQIPQNVLSLLG